MTDNSQTFENHTSPDLRCGRCLQVVESAAAIAGVCAAAECEELLCAACWSADEAHLCERHQPTRVERLLLAQRAAAASGRPAPVTTGQARQMALNFLNRFDYQMRQLKALRHPLTGTMYQPADFAPGRWTAHPARLTPPWDAGDELDAAAPAGSRLSITVRGELTVEAVVICRAERFAVDGFDGEPLGAPELATPLNAAARQAEAAGQAHVLGLASPTGWAKAATDRIASSLPGQSFLHRLLLPYLVDLRLPRVWSNLWDTRLLSLPALFQTLTPEEAVQAVADWLRAACLRQGSVPLVQAVAETGSADDLVRQAFQQLAAAGAHVLVDVPALGLALTRR